MGTTISEKLIVICLIFSQIFATSFWAPTTCLAQIVPAMFIFGDSAVEVGNNFYIDTIATPNYPNGIDFPKGSPSGRFTNSLMITDVLGQEFGFTDYTPPFLSPNTTGDVVLKGVNYASSGAGILKQTGALFGERINMYEQLDYFAKTRQYIISRINNASEAQSLLRSSLYILAVGANDMLYEEYSFTKMNDYVDEMISTFRSQLTELYSLDARKIVVTNAPKIGCIPFEKDTHICAQDCVAALNKVCMLYNSKLKSLLEELTNNLVGSTFVYVDYYAINEDIINNYRSYGFENADHACCEVIGRHGGLIPCSSGSRVCPDRTKYVFWDPYHPTENAVLIGAKHVLDGGPEYVSPINLRQLVNSQ